MIKLTLEEKDPSNRLACQRALSCRKPHSPGPGISQSEGLKPHFHNDDWLGVWRLAELPEDGGRKALLRKEQKNSLLLTAFSPNDCSDSSCRKPCLENREDTVVPNNQRHLTAQKLSRMDVLFKIRVRLLIPSNQIREDCLGDAHGSYINN